MFKIYVTATGQAPSGSTQPVPAVGAKDTVVGYTCQAVFGMLEIELLKVIEYSLPLAGRPRRA